MKLNQINNNINMNNNINSLNRDDDENYKLLPSP